MRTAVFAISSIFVMISAIQAGSQTCPTCIGPASPICPLKFEGNEAISSIVSGCHASVTSNWDDGWKTESCNGSVPQGTSLLNYKLNVTSSNNGNSTVSKFTAGSMKYTEVIDEAYKGMYEAAVKYGDANYAAEIKREWDRHRSIAQQWEGTSDAVRLTVTAKGSGDWWDRWRGWEASNVDLEVICLAPANLSEQLEEKLDFNKFSAKSEDYVSILNDTPDDILGLVQPLPVGEASCQSAKGQSSGFRLSKSAQKNIRINDALNNKYGGMCIVIGKTEMPGYADFRNDCVLAVGNLAPVSSLPAQCIVN